MRSTPKQSAYTSQMFAVAVALLLCSGCAAEVGGQREYDETEQALIISINPPAGWSAGRIYIGTDANGDSRVYYRNNLSASGACVYDQHIGNVLGTLFDRTRVYASSAGDEIWVLAGSDTMFQCPGLPRLNAFAGGKLEVYGKDGADYISALGSNANGLAFGEGGNDHILVGNIYRADGGGGNDKTVGMTGIESTALELLGGDGDDLLCHWGSLPIPVMNGGANSPAGDWGWFSDVAPLNVNGTEGSAAMATCQTALSESQAPIGN